jgi:hypothetical protein
MYNRLSKFKESKINGYPCFWVDIDKYIDFSTEVSPHDDNKTIINAAHVEAKKVMGDYIKIFNKANEPDEKPKEEENPPKEENRSRRWSVVSKKPKIVEQIVPEVPETPIETNFGGRFYVLHESIFTVAGFQNKTNNILKVDFCANRDFS